MAGFLKLNRSEDIQTLARDFPNAFRLLFWIAYRARRSDCPITGLKKGECYLGDLGNIGFSEQSYRTEKARLEKLKISTFRPTSRGTIATLCDSTYYDINFSECNEQTNGRVTNDQRTGNDQLTTNKKERKKECKKERTLTGAESNGKHEFRELDLLDKAEVGASAETRVHSSPVLEFEKLWCQEYKPYFGTYVIKHVRDRVGLSDLLNIYSPSDLIAIAKRAWDRMKSGNSFFSKNAATIRGFVEKFNNIRAEVAPTKKEPESICDLKP